MEMAGGSDHPPDPGSQSVRKKRSRVCPAEETEQMLGFWSREEEEGRFILISSETGLFENKSLAWVQTVMRGILGKEEKADLAKTIQGGKLLVKTKNPKQTEKLLKTKKVMDIEVLVEDHPSFNRCQGKVYAPDMITLSEQEVKEQLESYGVVDVKRITKEKEGKKTNTPLLILTFNRISMPNEIRFDYGSYKVEPSYPRPRICYRCGEYGHGATGFGGRKCVKEERCLKCGGSKDHHDSECEAKCMHCGEGHKCIDRDCSVYKSEQEIMVIKVKRGVSFMQAKGIYEREKGKVSFRGTVQRQAALSSERMEMEKQKDDEWKKVMEDKITKLTETISNLVSMLGQRCMPVRQEVEMQGPKPAGKEPKSGKGTDGLNSGKGGKGKGIKARASGPSPVKARKGKGRATQMPTTNKDKDNSGSTSDVEFEDDEGDVGDQDQDKGNRGREGERSEAERPEGENDHRSRSNSRGGSLTRRCWT